MFCAKADQPTRDAGLRSAPAEPGGGVKKMTLLGPNVDPEARLAWIDGEFKSARLDVVFLDKHQTCDSTGVVTFCQGSKVRLLFLVSRPEKYDGDKEKFKSDWLAYAPELSVDIRLHLADDPRAIRTPGFRPRQERTIATKGCNLMLITEDLATGGEVGLTPEELAQTEEAQADLCYLVESDIEVKMRHLDRLLAFALHISLQGRSSQAGRLQREFETRAGHGVETVMTELVNLSFTSAGSMDSRTLYRGIKIVEPISITSTYACHNDGSYINIQIENRHPVLDLVIQDVGFHLTHSVRSTTDSSSLSDGGQQQAAHVPASAAPPLLYPRMDRTLSYKGAAGALMAGEDPGEPPLLPNVARPTPRLPGSTRDSNVFSPIALPSYLSSIADPGTSAPTPHSKAGPPPLLSPKSGGGPPTDFATASGDAATPASSAVSPPTVPGMAGDQPLDMLTPTNRGQNTFISLTSLFRVFWVERVTLPLVIQPGFRHGMVFRVEPYPARPDLADYFRQQQPDAQPFHGPFWTPLTIAWVVQSAELPSDAPGAQSPVFFTDKMVSWDASAPVNQDLSVSIEVEPSVQLNEIFTVTLTIVNLTGVVVDLILKAEGASKASVNNGGPVTRTKASFSITTHDGGRRTPRSARRMKTFMALRRLASSEMAGDKPTTQPATQQTALPLVFSHEDEEDDEEEEEEEDDEEEGEEEWGGGTRRYEELGPRGARRERCSEGNLVVLDTAMPVGLLNHLDERTIQVQLLAVRAGLCRLSNLVLEETRTKQAYRLTRPLEIFVRQQDSKVIGGPHQRPTSFFACASPI